MSTAPVPTNGRTDLKVRHSILGRLRLSSDNLRARPHHAREVVRSLSAVPGVRAAQANPTTGSIVIHYHPSALKQAEFFAEIAAALALIAVGIDPGEVKTLFEILGVSPDVESLPDANEPRLLIPLTFFLVGFLLGRRSS